MTPAGAMMVGYLVGIVLGGLAAWTFAWSYFTRRKSPGECYADYSALPRDQLDAAQPELDELFKNSKVVSVKRDP